MTLLIEKNVSLLGYNSLALEAIAEHFCVVKSVDDIQQAIAFARDQRLTIIVLGAGSNVVLRHHLAGLVVHVQITGVQFERIEHDVLLHIGAGENWSSMVEYCLQNNWFGIENLILIPGNVGAAPVQNIGAYGVELSDSFVSLEAIDIATGKVHVMQRDHCEFGYRDSVFKNSARDKYIITRLCLKLSLKPNMVWHYPALKAALEAKTAVSEAPLTPHVIAASVTEIRRQKLPDPKVLPNAGSFFKNPVITREVAERLLIGHPNLPVYQNELGECKVPAGWLIEQCGYKGLRQGSVGVHPLQALVLVNYGGDNAAELLAFSETIKVEVEQTFGIHLELEPTVYGSF